MQNAFCPLHPLKESSQKFPPSPLTSSHAEQHPEDFADQGPETDDSGHLHPIQVAFDLGDPGTRCHRLEEEAQPHSNPAPHRRDNLLAWVSDSAGLRGMGGHAFLKSDSASPVEPFNFSCMYPLLEPLNIPCRHPLPETLTSLT